jgi:transcriptional regulator with XRE-family HTH domain
MANGRQATDLDKTIAQRMKYYRCKAGIRRVELAALIGMSHQQIHKYENAVNRMSVGKFFEYLSVLGIDISINDILPITDNEIEATLNMDSTRSLLKAKGYISRARKEIESTFNSLELNVLNNINLTI